MSCSEIINYYGSRQDIQTLFTSITGNTKVKASAFSLFLFPFALQNYFLYASVFYNQDLQNLFTSIAGNTKVKASAFSLFLFPFALQNFFCTLQYFSLPRFTESFYNRRWKYKSES